MNSIVCLLFKTFLGHHAWKAKLGEAEQRKIALLGFCRRKEIVKSSEYFYVDLRDMTRCNMFMSQDSEK